MTTISFVLSMFRRWFALPVLGKFSVAVIPMLASCVLLVFGQTLEALDLGVVLLVVSTVLMLTLPLSRTPVKVEKHVIPSGASYKEVHTMMKDLVSLIATETGADVEMRQGTIIVHAGKNHVEVAKLTNKHGSPSFTRIVTASPVGSAKSSARASHYPSRPANVPESFTWSEEQSAWVMGGVQ